MRQRDHFRLFTLSTSTFAHGPATPALFAFGLRNLIVHSTIFIEIFRALQLQRPDSHVPDWGAARCCASDLRRQLGVPCTHAALLQRNLSVG